MMILKVTQSFNQNYTPDNNQCVHDYIVQSVENSTSPHINERLSMDQLNGYCDDEDWKVIIK